MMYPTFRAELARKGMTIKALADSLGVGYYGLYARLAGKNRKSKSEIPLDLAVRIKEVLGVDMPVEELFRRSE